MSNNRIDKRFLALLYILAFVLLREWLIPVMELTSTEHLSLFLFFIVLAFIIALAGMKWRLSVPIKLVYIFWVVHYVFLDKVLFSKKTVVFLFQDLASNVAIIASGDWESITNPFRTILFFVLLWMTTYLIRHWMESRKSIFLFYIMTVVFIAFIDTFSEYTADGAIFRIMVAGLLLVGLLYISRLAEKHDTPISLGAYASVSVPLLFAVVLSGAFANFLPKQDPIWPDPFPYFESLIYGTGEGEKGGGVGVSKSGYDPDDSMLGGPFLKDSTLVFEAEVKRKKYWKVETKNTYTSKGWEQFPLEGEHKVYHPGMEMGETQHVDSTGIELPGIAKINMSEKFPFLIYPYGMTKAFATDDVLFLHSLDTGKYFTKIGDNQGSLDAYEIEYIDHEFSLKALRATTIDSFSTEGDDFSQYLQLPEQLPDRVKELAETITASSVSVYDKTKVIERYFGRNGFIYDQQNVAIPKGEQDYVDQFLFDTKRGYCDNFSTSMVVLLRTIGIPARWVKGFAPGEISFNASGDSVYRITNNEAHSWVEAYMPGLGWMPFEPTIGFGAPASIDYDIELDLSDPEIPEKKEQEQERPKLDKPEEVVAAKPAFDLSKVFGSAGSWVKENIWKIVIAIGITAFTGWKLYMARGKWLPKVLIPMYRTNKGNWKTYSKRYNSLLKQLDRFGLKRRDGVTLSVYAAQVDKYFGGELMKELTSAYEKGLYGGDFVNHDWEMLKKMWEDLINRTSG